MSNILSLEVHSITQNLKSFLHPQHEHFFEKYDRISRAKMMTKFQILHLDLNHSKINHFNLSLIVKANHLFKQAWTVFDLLEKEIQILKLKTVFFQPLLVTNNSELIYSLFHGVCLGQNTSSASLTLWASHTSGLLKQIQSIIEEKMKLEHMVDDKRSFIVKIKIIPRQIKMNINKS